MGFGAGHILDMINSLKNNKRSRQSMFEKDASGMGKTYGEFVDHKKMSEEELEAFRSKFIQQQQKEKRKKLLVFGILMILVIAFFGYVLFYI
ncbi:MAG: hypothetical protein Aureis2KO_14540 [Aureisphaera sp.]